MSRDGIVLEMTNRGQLRPAALVRGMMLEVVSPSAASTVRQLYRDVWRQLGGGGRRAWTADRWADELADPSIKAWTATIDGKLVGFAEMEWRPDGDVGIVEIGIVPSAQGRGIGGDLLTRCTLLAWQLSGAHGRPTSRVWVWTVPDEHPHTISNYLNRGFAVASPAEEPT